MSKKIYLDLTEKEKTTCYMQLLFFAKSGIKLENFKTDVMSYIFYSLYVKRCIDVKDIEIFVGYVNSSSMILLNEVLNGKSYDSKTIDDILNLTSIVAKIEKKVFKDE